MKSKEHKSTLEKLKLKQDALKARIEKLTNQQKEQNRKQETRKKILVGSYYLEQVEKNGKIEELKKAMSEFLTRKSDRAIFGLQEILPKSSRTKS